jgi:spore germination cell wall hydrolase CwlJ-like protein
MNWYKIHDRLEEIRLASLNQEASSNDFFSAVLFAVSLLLGGASVSEASEKARVPKKAIEIAKNVPKIREKAKAMLDISKMKEMTNEQKKQYLDSVKGIVPPAQKNPSSSESKKEIPAKQESVLSISDILARTIYAEAEGEIYDGKKAVASVIYNRANGDVGKMVSVVKAKKQFSCWNNGTPSKGHGKAWEDSVKIANELVGGNFIPTTTHTFYYNPDKANPSWAKGVQKQKIGNHLFLTI